MGRSARLLAGRGRDLNREAVAFAREVCEGAAGETPVSICGTLGPEGDGYSPDSRSSRPPRPRSTTPSRSRVFAGEGVDMISAYTLTYVEEAVGIVRAAAAAGLPVSISFTVETDGRLPSDEPLREAVERLDAETGGGGALPDDQLRPPDPLRRRAGRATVPGSGGSAASAPTPRAAATPNSTKPRSSTAATRRSSAPNTPRSSRTSRPARRRRLLRHRPAPRRQHLRPAHRLALPSLSAL